MLIQIMFGVVVFVIGVGVGMALMVALLGVVDTPNEGGKDEH